MNVLEEAMKTIYGDREKTYGDPGKNLRTIAAFWSTLFGVPVTPVQVCQAMVLLKQARLMNDPTHRDSWVDTCGYAALPERMQEAAKVQDPKWEADGTATMTLEQFADLMRSPIKDACKHGTPPGNICPTCEFEQADNRLYDAVMKKTPVEGDHVD